MLVRSDVGGNIKRLATRAATDPAKYQPNVFAMVTGEVAAGEAGGSSSCTKGLLWLKRWGSVGRATAQLHTDRPAPAAGTRSFLFWWGGGEGKGGKSAADPAACMRRADLARTEGRGGGRTPGWHGCIGKLAAGNRQTRFFLLRRAMQFVTALLLRLTQDREVPLSTAASETYYATLHQYHGWLVTGTFTVALKLVPSRESFLAAVGADTEAGLRSMAAFAEEFGSLLAVLHAFLDARGLDDPTKV